MFSNSVDPFWALPYGFHHFRSGRNSIAIADILRGAAGTALVIVTGEEKIMKTPTQLLLSVATVLMALTTINCGGGSSGSSSTPAAATPAAYGASCGTNMLTSQYGCLTACGPSSVMYNGQCMPITQTYGTNGYGQPGYGTGIPGQPGYGGIPGQPGYGQQNPMICQGACPPGLVSVSGGQMCMPQGACGVCYAQVGNNCYIGDYAHQY